MYRNSLSGPLRWLTGAAELFRLRMSSDRGAWSPTAWPPAPSVPSWFCSPAVCCCRFFCSKYYLCLPTMLVPIVSHSDMRTLTVPKQLSQLEIGEPNKVTCSVSISWTALISGTNTPNAKPSGSQKINQMLALRYEIHCRMLRLLGQPAAAVAMLRCRNDPNADFQTKQPSNAKSPKLSAA